MIIKHSKIGLFVGLSLILIINIQCSKKSTINYKIKGLIVTDIVEPNGICKREVSNFDKQQNDTSVDKTRLTAPLIELNKDNESEEKIDNQESLTINEREIIKTVKRQSISSNTIFDTIQSLNNESYLKSGIIDYIVSGHSIHRIRKVDANNDTVEFNVKKTFRLKITGQIKNKPDFDMTINWIIYRGFFDKYIDRVVNDLKL
jgi:hypothetical protein